MALSRMTQRGLPVPKNSEDVAVIKANILCQYVVTCRRAVSRNCSPGLFKEE